MARAVPHGASGTRRPSIGGPAPERSRRLLHRGSAGFEGIEEADHVVPQFVGCTPDRIGASGDEQGTRGQFRGSGTVHVGADGSQTPPETVSDDRTTHTLGDGERHAWGPVVGIIEMGGRQRASANPNPLSPQGHKGSTVPDGLDQADSFARPLRRRLRRMDRPARVDMRARNPWFLARLRTLG